jgi:hypothetical protein
MLPCNIVEQETGRNEIEIATIDPTDSLIAAQNDKLSLIVYEIRKKLLKMINSIK